MSTLQLLTLRSFVNERLTAAAEEILGVIERTMVEYREEVSRSVMNQCKQGADTRTTEPKQRTVSGCKEDGLPEQQDDPSLPPQVKEEQEQQPLTRQEEEEPGSEEKEETDILKFIFTHPPTITQSGQEITRSSQEITRSGQEITRSVQGQSCSLGNSHRAPQAISTGQMKMEPDDEGGCGTWETPGGCHILPSDAYAVAETGGDHFRKESGRARSHLHTHDFKTKRTTQTSCMVNNTAHLSHSSSPTAPYEMSTTGKGRTARYRARLNADPSAREQLLAKRRASYQMRKTCGLIDRTSIKDMSSEAQDRTRRMWRLAKQKQRQSVASNTTITAGSSSLEEDSSSSLLDDQGSPPLWIPAAYEPHVQRGNQMM